MLLRKLPQLHTTHHNQRLPRFKRHTLHLTALLRHSIRQDRRPLRLRLLIVRPLRFPLLGQLRQHTPPTIIRPIVRLRHSTHPAALPQPTIRPDQRQRRIRLITIHLTVRPRHLTHRGQRPPLIRHLILLHIVRLLPSIRHEQRLRLTQQVGVQRLHIRHRIQRHTALLRPFLQVEAQPRHTIPQGQQLRPTTHQNQPLRHFQQVDQRQQLTIHHIKTM